MNEQELPKNLLAEQGVLGAVQYDPACLGLVADLLTSADFQGASYHHPEIWEAMQWLYQHEQIIDIVTLVSRLKVLGVESIRDRPPTAYLGQLWNFALQNGVNVEEDARYVRNVSLRRKTLQALADMAAIVHQEEDAEAALAQCESILYRVNAGIERSDLLSLDDVMSDFLNDLDMRHKEKGQLVGVSTGLDDLNNLLGGLQPQELLLLGGLPGEGKTSLLLNILYDAILEQRLHIALFSLEMSKRDLARRLLSMDTQVNSQAMRTRMLELGEWERLIHSKDTTFSGRRIFVDESGDLTPAAMRTKLHRHEARHGKLDAIFVDYLQLMQDGSNEKQQKLEAQALSDIARELKQLAKHFNVPVLVVSSLSGAVENRASKRLQLSDIRGSRGPTYHADVVMFISRSQESPGYSIINVEKHRNGPMGDVKLRFDPTLTRFYDAEKGEL